MENLNIGKTSAWNTTEIVTYLHQTVAPCRLSSINKNGFPNVTSLWYVYDDGHMLFSARSNSTICKSYNLLLCSIVILVPLDITL